MIDIKRHQEFIDKKDKSTIYITSVDHWADEVHFTRHLPAETSVTFEISTIGEFDWFIEAGVYVAKDRDSSDCGHRWRHYSGLTHIYDYCIYCDAKRDHKNWYCDSRETYYED